MKQEDCDGTKMKIELKEHLLQLSEQIQKSIEALDHEHYCLLSEFARIREQFTSMESIASSYYLQCYLSPFTERYAELSLSIRHLSERRHGALIVVQRNDRLDALIHGGIPIGASLSYSLLESIFIPGSPLHDGAVLIKSHQIVSAANVLPLSHRLTSERKLGTRHRAALGLSEGSDALVLVVSEETGNASFAMHGSLYPINALEPLSYLPIRYSVEGGRGERNPLPECGKGAGLNTQ